MSLKQQASSGAEINEKMAALMNNAGAIRAVAAAVEGTLGPKGLDTMLVDKFGDVVITNDGVTILTMMEANHPAARMLINIARAQQEKVGDGTTTAAVMAGAMVEKGVEQVARGVPVTRVIEGLRTGIRRGLELIKKQSVTILDIGDPRLHCVALIAGRNHADIAELIMRAASLIGKEKLEDETFKFCETILAKVGAENQVLQGVVVSRERMNRQMPKEIENVRVLVVDDALHPEDIEDEALGTEAGFSRYIELQNQFRRNIQKAIECGVGLVIVDRAVDEAAEEMFNDAGVIVVQRVATKELNRVAEHTGARPVKRTALKKEPLVLEKYFGRAGWVYNEEKLGHLWVLKGSGEPMATVLVGAATAEVVGERERIARDAASAVQAAVKGGIVPGGGAVEVFVSRQVEQIRTAMRGMAAYGVDCVSEALKRPLSQIVSNAGFNPLEKIDDVISVQIETGKNSLAIDCDTGTVADMYELGVLDPTLVKLHALEAAGEIAEAILRIDTIIKKQEVRLED